MNNKTLRKFIENAAVYCSHNDMEAVRLNWYDHELEIVNCTGEESGNEYELTYSEMNDGIFYRLEYMNPFDGDGSDYC